MQLWKMGEKSEEEKKQWEENVAASVYQACRFPPCFISVSKLRFKQTQVAVLAQIQHIGLVRFDVDKNVKTIDEYDTVGIIICKQDNEYVIKYCSDDRIIAREYELV